MFNSSASEQSANSGNPSGLHVMLTNDDSADTPLLAPFVRYLTLDPRIDHLTVVVPAEEQSWASMSVSRFRPVRMWQKDLSLSSDDGQHSGKQIFLLSGSPADCVHIGVNHLAPRKPDIVISGINCGMNAGEMLAGSSGTVGAASIARLLGISGLALSAYLPNEVYKARDAGDYAALNALHADWERLAKSAHRVLDDLVFSKFSAKQAAAAPTTISCNLPWNVADETPLLECPLDRRPLHPIFRRRDESSFEFHFSGFAGENGRKSPAHPSDFEQLALGNITWTLLAAG